MLQFKIRLITSQLTQSWVLIQKSGSSWTKEIMIWSFKSKFRNNWVTSHQRLALMGSLNLKQVTLHLARKMIISTWQSRCNFITEKQFKLTVKDNQQLWLKYSKWCLCLLKALQLSKLTKIVFPNLNRRLSTWVKWKVLHNKSLHNKNFSSRSKAKEKTQCRSSSMLTTQIN